MKSPIDLVKDFLYKRKLKKERDISLQVTAFNLGYRAELASSPENKNAIKVVEDMIKELTNSKIYRSFKKGQLKGFHERDLIFQNVMDDVKQERANLMMKDVERILKEERVKKRKLEQEQVRKQEQSEDLKKMIDELPSHNQQDQNLDIDF